MKFLSRIAASIGLTLVLGTVSFAQHVRPTTTTVQTLANTRPTLGKGPNEGPAFGRPDQGCGKRRPCRQRLDGSSVGR